MGKALESQSFIKYVGEDRYKRLVNFILHYIADMDVPIKRYIPSPFRCVSKFNRVLVELSSNSEMG
jgi:phosphomannomutase